MRAGHVAPARAPKRQTAWHRRSPRPWHNRRVHALMACGHRRRARQRRQATTDSQRHASVAATNPCYVPRPPFAACVGSASA